MSCVKAPAAAGRPGAFLLLVLLCLICGCGKQNDWKKVYPVQGKLLVNGEPAEGAIISLVPEEDTANPRAIRSTAEVQSDGTFRLSTYVAHDGAPAGRHVVTVYWPEPLPEGSSAIDVGADRLQGRYVDPTDPLAYVTVKEEENVLEPLAISMK